jgi:hypothetical protein
MLRRVADDGDDHDPDERLRKVHDAQRPLERPDQDLPREPGRRSGEEEPSHRPPGVRERPLVPFDVRRGRLAGRRGKERPRGGRRDHPRLRAKLEQEREPVHDDEHGRDFLAEEECLRAGAGRGGEDGRDRESDHREEERRHRRARRDPVEPDGGKARARHHDRPSGDEEQVPEDAPGEAALHQRHVALLQGEQGHDQLGGVSEGGVEEAPESRTKALREVLCGVAHRLRERHEGQAGDR